MKVTGTIAAGESTSALAHIKGRRGISPRQTKLVLLVCMAAVGIPVGAWTGGAWTAGTITAAAITVEFAFLGLALGAFIIGRLAGPSLRNALARRGQAYEQPLTFELTPESLVYNLADVTMAARWSCVTDLYQTRRYWVFLVQSSAMVLPRRFFADRAAEQDFIAAVTARMTAAALARSPDASRFVAGA
ncbi:YcxB family protein [Sphingomonas glacialis]|uniref:YcxB family protein n=1 Tax=Sphingomonas glacialis TaxID=658225 RepID=A0A502G556_9SPHN|nr:YcxB family protein [Sphingomonas glacialis]TPG56073.1 YcxB family protein [Sphingomonas glacialis]